MLSPIDSVLLIAFGGPTKPEDVRPFLANVTRGRPIPADRLELVAHHYDLIGGRSPLNALTEQQADGLRAELVHQGPPLPVFIGMRNWHPFLHETLSQMRSTGLRHAAGLILSPQQNEAGWSRYENDVREARAAVGENAPAVTFAPPWATHPGFVEAVAAHTADACKQVPATERAAAQVIFTAHSIPCSMAAASPYTDQIAAGATAVARQLGLARWSIAYQSRSGNPRDPWLEPDVLAVLKQLADSGVRTVVVVPIGFVCDHVEVLYDLDIEARAEAERLGLTFVRASAVNDHPAFIAMLADLVRRTASEAPT